MTPRDIVSLLGRKPIADAVGVKPGAVSEALRGEKLPASWFIACRNMGQAMGAQIPDTAFNFKGRPTDGASS